MVGPADKRGLTTHRPEEKLPMPTIADFADDIAESSVGYRGRTIEFTFKPGAYTGTLVHNTPLLADVVAACVTKWNIDGADPTKREDVEKLPFGLIATLYRQIGEISTQADED